MQLKVISVDDSVTIANHLQNLLEKLDGIMFSGHAFTINEALSLLETNKPDIVFLDIFLKDENGIELLSIIKNKYPQIKIIMLSNHSEMFYKNKTKDLGADYFLDKSYEFDKIPEILKKIAEN
ncbi:response regulator [uncultured Planktosalinus sp.]|uniref:response regulator n=1 Tax=uncultured Planktosalinus sp. TaxID=1810935 RepID=UPI0030DB26EE